MSAIGTAYLCTLNENTTSIQKKYHISNSNTNNSSPPFTQDSSSMSTVHDDYDFKHMDRSSSFQTSTSSSVDEIKNETIQRHTAPDISSLSFYSGPSLNNNGLNSKKHANHLRKSIVISPSLNSVKSVLTDGSSDSKIADMSFDADQEVPTRTMGIVESPSIQALSDILTNKITSNSHSKPLEFGSIKEEEEPDENDASTILQNRHQISLIDDIYTPMQFNRNQSVATFYTANSTDTIKANYNDQPDLINLSSPIEPTTPMFSTAQPINKDSSNDSMPKHGPVEQTILKQNINPGKGISTNNYEDIFETFVPQKSNDDKKPATSPNQKRNSNRYSIHNNDMVSPAFSEFASPALGFNEPVQNFQLMNSNGLIHKSISKLSNRSDSIYEIGYDDGDDGFSFIPSEYDSDEPQSMHRFPKNKKKEKVDDTDKKFGSANVASFNEDNITMNQKKLESSQAAPAPFIRRHSHRLSMRMVKDSTYENLHDAGFTNSPDKNQFSSSPEKSYIPSGETPKLLPTLKMLSVPNLHPSTNTPISSSNFGSSPEVSNKVSIHNMHFSSSPSLLNTSPIRNSSPTFESIASSPKISSPKPTINLSSQKEENRPLSFKHTPKSTPVQPKIEKIKEEKHKNKKITFKGLFKRNTNEKISSTTSSSYSMGSNSNFGSHKKSFSFNNLDTFSEKTKQPEKKKEKKEKTRSLLSGWKRKSFSFAQPLEESKPKQKLFSKNLSVDLNSDNNLNTSNFDNHMKSKSSNNTSSKILFPEEQARPPSEKTVPSSPKQQFSLLPHKISNSALKINEKGLPSLPYPSAQSKKPLLQTYGFDKTPNLNQSPILSTPVNIQQDFKSTSPAWSSNPKINRSESYQTVQTEISPVKLASPLTADFIESSPHPNKNQVFDNDQKSQNLGNNPEIFNTSSNYDSIDIEDLQPPSFSASLNANNASLPMLALGIQTPTTQHSFDTPASDTVASFTASPNRYHIGDDMFPKHLGINEIESIVSLERSRSMRSLRSNRGPTPSIVSNRESQSLSHKNSILKRILNNEEDFHQLVMPDGMVVVRSPRIEQNSAMSSDHGASRKTSSILKKPSKLSENSQKTFLFNDDFNLQFDNNDISRASLDFEDSDMENDIDDMIKMINFDQGDEKMLDTEFNFDSSFSDHNLDELKSDYVAPDLIGNIDATYDSDNFNDLDSFNGNNVYLEANNSTTFDMPIPDDTEVQQRTTPVGSVDDIIKEEECYTKSNNGHTCQNLSDKDRYAYISQSDNEADYGSQSPGRPISMSFKGLKGPTFNSSLKPETQSAIIGSLTHQPAVDAIVPSDSENSISHMSQTYEDSKYHVNNPFRERIQDDIGNYDYLGNDYNNNYNEERNSGDFKPKSIGNQFMQKLSNNHFGHFSVNSLPVVTNNTEEKPSKLTKKRTKSAGSFSKLTMFGNSLMHNRDEEEEKPKVKFSSRILLYDTYGEDEYDRKPETATCNNLTPQLALDIKNELNEVKSEMAVHESSRCYTHFF